MFQLPEPALTRLKAPSKTGAKLLAPGLLPASVSVRGVLKVSSSVDPVTVVAAERLRVSEVALSMEAMTAPAGMPSPRTDMPTVRLVVSMLVTLGELAVRLAGRGATSGWAMLPAPVKLKVLEPMPEDSIRPPVAPSEKRRFVLAAEVPV